MINLSFRHPWLLQAILAVAALHKAVTTAEEKNDMYQQSLKFVDGAIAGVQQNLDKPDPATCSALFATACLLVIHSMGSAQVHVSPDPIQAVTEWMHLVKGASATLLTHWHIRESLQVAPLVNMGYSEPCPPGDTVEIQRLKDLAREQHYTSSTEQDACLQAISDLDLISAKLRYNTANPETSRRALVMGWPVTLSPAFIKLLSDKDATALVILAHFAMLFEESEPPWFTQHWVTSIITTIDTVGHDVWANMQRSGYEHLLFWQQNRV